MRAYTISIEQCLLARAYEGYIGTRGAEFRPVDPPALAFEDHTLEQAYAYCDHLTWAHSHTFYLASAFLSTPKRRAVRALYAFCRVSDDLVDALSGESSRQAQFECWRRRVLADNPPSDDPVALAWADTRLKYRMVDVYANQLLDGVAHDLQVVRYATLGDLASYCYGVASTVGLMSMHIVGFSGPEAIPYAVKLGVALQLTNILRDVGEDWRSGRLYLPLDELSAFGLSEENIAKGRLDGRWRAFMRFQIARARRLYAEAWPGIAMLHPDARFAIGAAATLYENILSDIEAHGMDVFTRRARVGTMQKLRLLPGTWYRTKVGGNRS